MTRPTLARGAPLWAIALLAAACSELPPLLHHPDDPPFEDSHELPPIAEPDLVKPTDGSLWRGDASRRFLAFENRARRTGDLVTVQIKERADAATNATTDLQRKSSFDADLNSAIALQNLVAKPVLRVLRYLHLAEQEPNPTPTANTSLSIVDATTNTKFQGDGSVERTSTLNTTIACVVTEVTPQGLLRIEGKRFITINRETQIIKVRGYVRPEDVQIDNTIPSSLIANADIEYGGEGVVSDKQRVPWVTRLFELLLPF